MIRKVTKVDFVIGYEIWQRELFGVILIKRELEKRGYSVELVNMCIHTACDYKRKYLMPKVVLYPGIYRNRDVLRALDFQGNVQHIINMECEQILSKDNYMGRMPLEYAQKAYHVCWGGLSYDRMLKVGIDRDHLRICGNVNLDINKPEYKEVFLSRSSLGKKYELDKNKKWIMYFSNFKLAEFKKGDLADRAKIAKGIYELSRIEKDARRITLEYFKQILEKQDDYIIIYRPHPVENIMSESLFQELETKYVNFRIIRNDTIQQWVKVCDVFLTYISTSMSDVFYSDKKAALLRPIDVPFEIDADTYVNTIPIRKYQELKDFLEDKQKFEVTSQETFHYAISNSKEDTGSYIKICDWLEDIYLKPSEDYSGVKYDNGYSFKHRLKLNILLLQESKTRLWLQKYFLSNLYNISSKHNINFLDFIPNILKERTFSEHKKIQLLEEKVESLIDRTQM